MEAVLKDKVDPITLTSAYPELDCPPAKEMGKKGKSPWEQNWTEKTLSQYGL